MADPDREVLISLCERVLAGEMTLADLEQAWPDPVEHPALGPLRETLSDAIEHTPGYWSRPGVNERAWRNSPEYGDIEFYLRRLHEAR